MGVDTTIEVKNIMLEHLNNLKTAAEECDEEYLSLITSAMIEAALFLQKQQ